MESSKTRWGRIPRILRWIVEHSARQSAIRALYRMPGWRLRDMGIERGRIPEIVDGLLARKRALAAENRRIPGAGQAAGSLDGATVSEAPV
ncbi:MAG: hypothetical protein OER43_06035 [Gammaproteobacteria bacterium]|nr:hypothetical protein [Gammaproteobacteria bacterium]MDH3411212.1 hypothetical protein [Gammaproteobacteria bacterium]